MGPRTTGTHRHRSGCALGRAALTLALGIGSLTVPAGAEASGESSQGSKGSNSDGSNNSSKSSGDSSNSSHDSSKSSNGSTQNSPQRSADWSSEETADSSTRSRGAQFFWAGSAVVLLGASIVGTVLGARSRARAGTVPNAVALAAFMRENHAVLTHDVAMTRGPVFDAWSRELGLTAADGTRVALAMEGSSEQTELMSALDGSIDANRAAQFSAAFFRVTARALGPVRTKELLARAGRLGPDGRGPSVARPSPRAIGMADSGG
jgi:hypothetical protein